MKTLTADQANTVFDVLVAECGALDTIAHRYQFISYMREDEGFVKEWRFCGSLGFGGKCYLNSNRGDLPYVNCYPEDETPGRLATIERANERIRAIFEPAQVVAS